MNLIYQLPFNYVRCHSFSHCFECFILHRRDVFEVYERLARFWINGDIDQSCQNDGGQKENEVKADQSNEKYSIGAPLFRYDYGLQLLKSGRQRSYECDLKTQHGCSFSVC